MKILLQNLYDKGYGGTESHFAILVKALIERGHELIVIYTASGIKNDIKRKGIKIFYLPGLDLPEEIYFSKAGQKEAKKDIDRLKAIVGKERPDIIHLHNTYYIYQFVFLKKYAPVIHTVHDFFNCCATAIRIHSGGICEEKLGVACVRRGCISGKNKFELRKLQIKYANRIAINKLDKIIVMTDYMRRVLIKNGFTSRKILVLHYFTDYLVGKAKKYEDIVIYVGRLTHEKGVHHFIQMLTFMSGKFKAFVIGEGRYREIFEASAKVLGVGDKVRFTGLLSVKELSRYYEKAALVVVSSLWPEPCCGVGIEAMAFRKPVVAYNVGGIQEWLQDGYNGYLVKRGDIEGLAEKVNILLKDRKLCKKMGSNGYRLFLKRFSVDACVPKLLSVYRALISKKVICRNGN